MIKIINNFSGSNHSQSIRDFFETSDHVVIVSPFLYEDFDNFFKELDISKLKHLELITTLKVSGDDQLKKPFSFLSLIKAVRGKNNKCNVSIHLDNNLHGKLYFFRKDEKNICSILTSANFTNSGLNKNHEWGIIIKDEEKTKILKEQVFLGLEHKNLSHEIITNKLVPLANQKRKELDNKREQNIDVGLLDLLETHLSTSNKELKIDEKNKFHLKPYGTREQPVLIKDESKFGEKTELRFPDPQPKSIKQGHVIIVFGTGSRAVLAIHKSTTNIEEVSASLQEIHEDYRRWRWFMNSINHTPKFGNCWWEHNITIDNLLEEYKILKPDIGINFGTFQRGAGRMEIDYDFAKFIIDRIMSIEEKL